MAEPFYSPSAGSCQVISDLEATVLCYACCNENLYIIEPCVHCCDQDREQNITPMALRCLQKEPT